ncbi:MAG: PD40 domain-containing protein [Phycisphaeraceae bacterium]|nr:PD40 domain-containing protein [Phycisphaeraceae bacterium]MCB9847023.1 PD40 domain-containing protein [Phycisphaeraceae bacterium]
MRDHQRRSIHLAALALTLTSVALLADDQATHDHGHANTPAQAPIDWRAEEAGTLTNYVQLTSEKDFTKAGEAYFDPDARWIIFQAVPRPTDGSEPDQHYSMYVAKLARNALGQVTGLESPIRISQPGSANTCGWFHPTQPWRVIFGSTLVPPADNQTAGYQRGTSKYNWQFPIEMEIVGGTIDAILHDRNPNMAQIKASDPPAPLWIRPGYDAEASYSPDGRFILYTQVDDQTGDGDLYMYDTTNDSHTPLITQKGYDGGPFFSPDGKMITYRSDRRGDDLLQIYVADLVFDAKGAITGIANERAVTDNQDVNWAPYWDPSGQYLIYATSEIGHHNYEVFAVEAPVGKAANKKPDQLAKRRITRADGFDGLSVFSNDGKMMMWTCQRGPVFGDEERPTSQVWLADVVNLDPRVGR